jgi:CubicO group peptidase (beta-lactamase class C family)
MRRIGKLIAALAMFALVPVSAQTPGPLADDAQAASTAGRSETQGAVLTADDLGAWLDGFMPYALDSGQIAGAVVVVVKDGEPIFEKGYGFADVARRRPVDAETTLFRTGSVSKLFTWTAVMQQVEAGKIDLDADVNTYLDFKIPPYRGAPITMRQIMTHTPGFEESIRYLLSSDPAAMMSLAEYAKKAQPNRVFAPGTTPAYSNYAAALAGLVVERVSGVPFDDYMDQRIFAPLGMDHSTFRQPLPANLKSGMSQGYTTIVQAPRPFEFVIPAPAGSMSASGSDMAKFMLAHLDHGGLLLKPETARTMHDFRAPRLGPLNTMALGFFEQQINGRTGIGHGGDTDFFHSYVWLFPDQNIGVYIAMNSTGKNAAAYGVRNALMQKFADRYFPDPRPVTQIDKATAQRHAQMLAGTYVSSRGSFTNSMSILGLLGSTEISIGADGRISVPDLDILSAGARDWVEIEPFVWRDLNSGERLAAEVKDGKVVRVSIDAISPFTVLMPAPVSTNPAWLMPSLLIALALSLAAALGWPVRALVRRRFKAEFALTRQALVAYRLTRAFAWAVLLVAIGWGALIQAFLEDSGALGGPLDWLIILLRIATPLASFGLLAAAGWDFWLMIRGKRPWTAHLGAVSMIFAGLILALVTIQFHLYGFGMVF